MIEHQIVNPKTGRMIKVKIANHKAKKTKKLENIKGGVILSDPNPNQKINSYVDQLRGLANQLI